MERTVNTMMMPMCMRCMCMLLHTQNSARFVS